MTFDLQTFTFVHVVISLVGIGSGFVVMFGLLKGKRLDGWTALFLATTVATSVTGFFFPFQKFTPAHGVSVIIPRFLEQPSKHKGAGMMRK